jgi:hypothetical protein
VTYLYSSDYGIIIHAEKECAIYSSGTIDYILFYDREELFIIFSYKESSWAVVGVASKDFHSSIMARYAALCEMLGKVRWSIY